MECSAPALVLLTKLPVTAPPPGSSVVWHAAEDANNASPAATRARMVLGLLRDEKIQKKVPRNSLPFLLIFKIKIRFRQSDRAF